MRHRGYLGLSRRASASWVSLLILGVNRLARQGCLPQCRCLCLLRSIVRSPAVAQAAPHRECTELRQDGLIRTGLGVCANLAKKISKVLQAFLLLALIARDEYANVVIVNARGTDGCYMSIAGLALRLAWIFHPLCAISTFVFASVPRRLATGLTSTKSDRPE